MTENPAPTFHGGRLGKRLANIANLSPEEVEALRPIAKASGAEVVIVERHRFNVVVADMARDPSLNLHRTMRRLREAGGMLSSMRDDEGKPLLAGIQRDTVTIDGPRITADVILEIPEGILWTKLRERLNIPDPTIINTEEPS